MKVDGSPVRGSGFDSRSPNVPIKASTAAPAADKASQLDALVAAENRLAAIDLADAAGSGEVLERILGDSDRQGRRGIGSLSIRV